MKNSDNHNLGRVSVTKFEPSTTHEFYFITNEPLSVLDIVKVLAPAQQNDQKETPSYVYGYVQEIRQLADSESHLDNYISNRFLQETKDSVCIHKKINFYCVKVRVIYDDTEIYAPVKNQEYVVRCNKDDITKALYISGKEPTDGISVGEISMYGESIEIKVDKEYLLGPTGSAHLNISGISGLACKTSYIKFLIKNIQAFYEQKQEQAPVYILFNVKGNDLSENNNYLNNFNIIEKTKLNFSFKDCKNDLDLVCGLINDVSGNMETVYRYLENNQNIKIWKNTIAGDTPTDVDSRTWAKYKREYNRIVNPSNIFNKTAKISRFEKISYSPNNIYVYDINGLNEHEQNFIVGYIIRRLFKKNESGKDKNTYIIFMDELNKFAPAGHSTPIIDHLEDISERGRQLGLILFGAEQFRSKINERILGNCAANVYGRTNSSELVSKEYGHLSNDDKNALTTLNKGNLLFTHAFLRCPVKIKFEDPNTPTESTDNSSHNSTDGKG